MATQASTTVGRRKESVARVRVFPGTGNITINGRTMDEYFGRETSKMILVEPLKLVDQVGKLDIFVVAAEAFLEEERPERLAPVEGGGGRDPEELERRRGRSGGRLAGPHLHRLPGAVPAESAALDPLRPVELQLDPLNRGGAGTLGELAGKGREPARLDDEVVVDDRDEGAPRVGMSEPAIGRGGETGCPAREIP